MNYTTADTTVGIVGLGYVGLPLALAMSDAGYEVIGVDVDPEKVRMLEDGQSYVSDVSDQTVTDALGDGFQPTTEYADLSDVTGVSLCVPTPLRKSGQPDISYVVQATEQLSETLPEECTVVLESTVYPQATEEIVAETLADNGRTIGEDAFVAFSPERIDPGNEQYGVTNIPKVIGGVTPACGDRAEALYDPVFDQLVRVDNSTEAELVKLLENTFRGINIGLINELAMIADQLDADIWNVVDAAATKPFGFMPFYPGPGLGGHCIPVDPQYLSWKANQQGIETRFIDLADQVNRGMPEYVVNRVVDVLNQNGTASIDANVLVLGVAYKADVSDTRESPALDIITLLEDRGVSVEYHDPHVGEVQIGDQQYTSKQLTDETLAAHDCVLITTDHSQFAIDRIVEQSTAVFDTRNATAVHADAEHVHRL
ncbi:nucleotide sugar dehydrogenase [Natronorubrum bangense]|uniref:UDP-N-acetyl-D-mannosamine dehydrogenase n=1 Tax=Natronorubrum bangense JCM 10635 TaxID=1227500 RepID=L9W2W8_9EURY|nr:nucleotide sugar dehydrogenase [Natronorubrum bangense]ELY42668.1 nucleotide sugar dehydrogenase [Natronorubrum bangense JCM 10635]